MATNSNNQLINIFSKGMNTDTSDAFMSNDQYRFAKNLRFLTETGENSGELRLIEGWKDVDSISDEGFELIGAATIRHYALFVVKENGRTQDDSDILYYKIYKYDSVADTITEIYSDTEAFGDYISMVTRWEDEDNIKLYIADGKHPIMSLNIYDNTVKTYNDISSTPEINFGKFISIQRISGNLKPAVVQYSYVLYNKYGNSSQMSQLSQPMSVYSVENNIDKGWLQDQKTGQGFYVSIDISRGTYERIRLYRITYVEIGQAPTIELIDDEKLNDSGKYRYADKGVTTLEEISLADYIALTKVPITPKYIESKNDYLFAGNIEYSQFEDPDLKAAYEAFEATAKDYYERENNTINPNLDLSQPYDKDMWWDPNDVDPNDAGGIKISGRGTNITWRLHKLETVVGDKIHPATYKSLRRDEVYRYGIILYDYVGNKWPVKWIADIRIPDAYTIPMIYRSPSLNTLMALIIGIDFEVRNIDTALFPNYEIVRCERTADDKATVSQGIVGRCFQLYYENELLRISTNYVCPTGFLTTAYIYTDNYDKNDRKLANNISNIVQFCSPETVYTPTYILDVLNANKQGLYLNKVYSSRVNETTLNINDDRYLWVYKENPSSSGVSIYGTTRLASVVGGLQFIRLTIGVEYSAGNFFKSHPSGWQRYELEENGDQQASIRYYEYTFDEDALKDDPFGIKLIHNKVELSSLNELGSKESAEVSDYAYVESPEWNSFASGEAFTYMNSSIGIGQYTYIPWSMPLTMGGNSGWLTGMQSMYKDSTAPIVDVRDFHTGTGYVKEDWSYRYPIGSSGRCILLNTETLLGTETNLGYFPVSVFNLRKATTPYGGYTQYAREHSKFVSHGNFFKSSETSNTIYDGDCYIQMFYYNALHSWYSDVYKYAPKMSTVYIVPVESDIDMCSDSGESYKRNPSPEIQDEPAAFKRYVQTEPAYVYNTAYGTEPNVQTFLSADEETLTNNKYDYRACYSNIKENNEVIDSWLNFKTANFLDVDTRYGEITNLRLFKNSLMFWQKEATGVLSVNERTLLQDVTDTNIILGNGDVLQRYDYLTTEFGMKPELGADTLSGSTIYWWDGSKKEVIAYSGGQQTMPMKKLKLVSNYINKYDEVERPALAYDFKYNEVLMSVVNGHNSSPLVYSEIIQQFTSIYLTPFTFSVRFPDKMFLWHPDGFMKEWNKNGGGLRPYLKYIVNDNNTYVKVFDNVQFGGSFYGNKVFYNDEGDNMNHVYNEETEEYEDKQPLLFTFHTLDLDSSIHPTITNREYDFRFAIPRNNGSEWSDRMRGKTMRCELESTRDSIDFSIQYIITKYRISWS